jgi:hypothetical protein
MRMCDAVSVERMQFHGGSRYMVRFMFNGVEVHIVGKGDRLFVEFWISRYATPIVVMDYTGLGDADSVCREICSMIYTINPAPREAFVTEIWR